MGTVTLTSAAVTVEHVTIASQAQVDGSDRDKVS